MEHHFAHHTTSVEIGGRTITFETGKIARQAHGSVLLRCEDTVLFSSVCVSHNTAETIDFLPLRIDYQEKFSSAGKTLGGFIKREGKPSEREILISRLIDRPIRPMFPDGYFSEVQLLSYVWSYDGKNSPDPLAICCASAALVISEAPLIKPIGAVRVGKIEDRFVVNPTIDEMKISTLDLMIAGSEDAILMIEGYCDFLTEEQVLEAIETGHSEIKKICHTLSAWQKEVGKEKNTSVIRTLCPELLKKVHEIVDEPLKAALRITKKKEREEGISAVKAQLKEQLLDHIKEDGLPYTETEIHRAYNEISARFMREMIVNEKIRCDGRDMRQIRPIDVEQGLLPRVHGSSLFTRGETQSLAICTLGSEQMGLRYETLDGDFNQRFYMQYFFPPFSVGEVGRIGPVGRREVGHGKLAERALQIVIPDQSKFPYSIRLESNITESNGSSSMASVCGGCLALMDAGVPIKRPVSGIAMGLILQDKEYVILSDILGVEDALGDMDFKVTGDHQGITAFQMDIKVEGITLEIMRDALAQAKEGRIHILNKMLNACPRHKEELSTYAPRIESIQVKPNKIATIIGPGGKQIKAIIEMTGVQIDINDTGLVNISSVNAASLEKAKAIILGLIAEAEIGKVYDGRVTTITAFGAFIEIFPGKEGLCHISELDHMRIEKVTDVIKEGDIVPVKVLDIDEKGKVKLSRRVLLARPPKAQ